uniref:ComEC/Rec2 family competence protein n=1 Tax=uncultured Campylobacter sp. TaxID=218934 RepID=UPI00261F9F82
HPDADHIGGMAELIADADIKSIWAPNATNNTETFRNFLSAIDKKGLTITQATSGTTIAKTDQYSIDILWPPSSAHFDNTNDYSIIIKLTVGEKTFLFTGDAPAALINQAVEDHIDVLKVSHHGSRTGTTKKLAAKLSPDYAVMSYAIGNDYGHPSPKTLSRVTSLGMAVARTDTEGSIAVSSGDDGRIGVRRWRG